MRHNSRVLLSAKSLALTVGILLYGDPAVHAEVLPASKIHVRFLGCSNAQLDAGSLRLFIVDVRSSKTVSTAAMPNFVATSLGADADLSLAPGFYDLGVIGNECRDETLIPVLAGHNQSVLLIGSNTFRIRESTRMIAGVVPLSGYNASIVYWPQEQQSDGPKRLVVIPARVEGDAYYASGLPAGKARLRISSLDGGSSLEFTIGEIGPTALRGCLWFNLTQTDIENAMMHPLPP